LPLGQDEQTYVAMTVQFGLKAGKHAMICLETGTLHVTPIEILAIPDANELQVLHHCL